MVFFSFKSFGRFEKTFNCSNKLRFRIPFAAKRIKKSGGILFTFIAAKEGRAIMYKEMPETFFIQLFL